MPPPLRYKPEQLRAQAAAYTGQTAAMLEYAADLSEYVRRPKTQNLEIGTLLSAETGEARIELAIDERTTQMDVRKAREILAMLSGAIEAAVSDQLIFVFLTTKVGLEREQAARALVDFREIRQGSRSTVYPT